MLFSPARIHDHLSTATSSTDAALPHTAMLITPAGQIMSFVSTPPGYDYYEGQEEEGGEPNGDEGQDGDEGDVHEEDGEEEPWLDTPERLRLILGLVSEFTEGIVNKIESELGKLLVSPIDIDTPSSTVDAILPAVRPPVSSSFLLVLNGSAKSDWAQMTTKVRKMLSRFVEIVAQRQANEFKESWAEGR